MGNHPFTMQLRKSKLFGNNKYSQASAGSVIVITGASSGMGKEFVNRYSARGCKLVIGSRNIDSSLKN
jgi:NADP-dependent 3-hydroxy acid dehydrogenase YdfG